MSKRLQVLLPDSEMAEIRRLAKLELLTVGEWVLRSLRDARANRPAIDPETMDPKTKLKAVRRGAQCAFPTASLDQMLSEIERGYEE